MKALILAAGFGTRMQAAYPGKHKILLPIGNNQSILEHNLDYLAFYGFDEIYINLHYLAEKVVEKLEATKKPSQKIKYIIEPEIKGTAGALHGFKNDLTETFLVLYGDVVTNLNLADFYNFHLSQKSMATLVTRHSDHPHDSDLLLCDKRNHVVSILAKPNRQPFPTDLSSAAIYLFEPEVLNFLPRKIPSDFIRDFFPRLLKHGLTISNYLTTELTMDVGTPERYTMFLSKYSLNPESHKFLAKGEIR